MAGAKVEGEEDLSALIAMIRNVAERTEDFTPVTEKAALRLQEMTRGAFRDSRQPDGASWAPLSPATKAIKKKQGKSDKKPLEGLRGSLARTMRKESDALHASLAVLHPTAELHLQGTTRAKVFGKGEHTIPARPFFPNEIPREILEDILNDAIDYLLEEWSK